MRGLAAKCTPPSSRRRRAGWGCGDAHPPPLLSFPPQGEAAQLTAAVARCRAERTTLTGALLAGIAAAHSRNGLKPATPGSCLSAGLPERVVASVDADFNYRTRVTCVEPPATRRFSIRLSSHPPIDMQAAPGL